ncbi:hypothetical protein D3C85_770980 [compost metagenome]
MSQDAINLIAYQRELETLFNKNQLITRIKSEFIDCKDFDFAAYFEANDVPTGFGFDLLVQMNLHKRCDIATLIGVMNKHLLDVQATADMLEKCARLDLVDWSPHFNLFIVKFTISADVQEELDRFQYPLPMVVRPRLVRTNRDTGMLNTGGSLILKNNHHEGDICLDHINRSNDIKFTINFHVADMVKNQWKGLDKAKPGEPREEFEKRKRAFVKYDRTARDVMKLITEHGNEFWLLHKYDKRGRTYCQGYHVNFQGSPWNKAIVEFANKEIIE